MPTFEFSRWDGSQEFSPQSADKLFDQLTEYLLDHGEQILPSLERLEEDEPEMIDMLVKRGYVEKDKDGNFRITPRGIKRAETKALDELFQITRRDKLGKHDTDFRGTGQTMHDESKPYEYGDPVANLNLHETLRNALVRGNGKVPVEIAEDDLVVFDTEYQTSCATVVLIDMSGSMNRYGKYGQAKRVALALQALVRSKYPGDFLQIVGFGTFATPLNDRELFLSAPKPVSIFDSRVHLRINMDQPQRFVPEHFTNIHAGLQFARRILRRQSAANKQIITITDGEPTAHVEGREVVLIYPPAERTARITLAEAKRCSAEGLHLSSFALIEDYFYLGLVNFVEQMAAVSGGVSAYCNADDLGNLVIESFSQGGRRRRTVG